MSASMRTELATAYEKQKAINKDLVDENYRLKAKIHGQRKEIRSKQREIKRIVDTLETVEVWLRVLCRDSLNPYQVRFINEILAIAQMKGGAK